MLMRRCLRAIVATPLMLLMLRLIDLRAATLSLRAAFRHALTFSRHSADSYDADTPPLPFRLRYMLP